MEPAPTVTVIEHGAVVIGRGARAAAVTVALLVVVSLALIISLGSASPKSPRAPANLTAAPTLVSIPADIRPDRDGRRRDPDDR